MTFPEWLGNNRRKPNPQRVSFLSICLFKQWPGFVNSVAKGLTISPNLLLLCNLPPLVIAGFPSSMKWLILQWPVGLQFDMTKSKDVFMDLVAARLLDPPINLAALPLFTAHCWHSPSPIFIFNPYSSIAVKKKKCLIHLHLAITSYGTHKTN